MPKEAPGRLLYILEDEAIRRKMDMDDLSYTIVYKTIAAERKKNYV
ncbi:MAG: hypothetical protein SOX46_05855 [Clostridiaceae bacterium]|nr:hypothetical protein [Clostridium porci]MDY3231088.1 hypothetical protein [Clostridiaceae bacterium]